MRLHRPSPWLCLGLAFAASSSFGAPAPIGPIEGQVLIGGGAGGSNSSVWIITNGGGNNAGLPTEGFCTNAPGLTVVDAAVGGHTDAVDAGLTLWVNDQIFVAPPTVELTEQTLTAGPVSMSGLDVTMQYHAVTSTATLRTLARFTNRTGAAIDVAVQWVTNVGSDGRTVVVGTSSGDGTFTPADRWVVTSAAPPNLAVNTHVLFGPGGLAPTDVSSFVFECFGREGILTTYQLQVPAGATRSLLFFNQLNTTDSAALAGATTFDANALGSDLLMGLSPADLGQIVNWNLSGGSGPPNAPEAALITGAGPGGGPHVRTFKQSDWTERLSFFAYHPRFAGGVHVAGANLNGGARDVITGAGPGGGPHVQVFDGETGTVRRSFFAYDPAFTGGVFVAGGDVNGDGIDDIITGAGAGGGPHVKVFDGVTGQVIRSFFAYHPAFTGGVRVAAGDVDLDGRADIITGPGPGGGPHVRVFSGANGSELFGFFAYGPSFTGGVFVAAGDVTGDARADVITGAGAGGGPHVRVFDGATGMPLSSTTGSFLAYEAGFTGGVWVAAGDLNGDGRADIITGAGAGGSPHVRGFSGADGTALFSFFSYSSLFTGGVSVGF